MDQEKIGIFIAECRKKKKLTQSQLAEKLGVTDRSVSKWENGRCMPDVSLFKPLCNELGISINELLSGEKLKKEEYQEKFEDNIVKLVNQVKKDDRKRSDAKIFMMILVSVIIIFIIYVIYSNIYFYLKKNVNYDSRIMKCYFENNQLIYQVKGLSILDSDYVEVELNGERIFFISTKLPVRNEDRKNVETWEGMANLVNGNDTPFESILIIDLKENDKVRVYHTNKSLNKIKKTSKDELINYIVDSTLMCKNK